MTVTPPTNATSGTEVNIPVTVHYPEGSTETTNAKVTVTPKDPSETDAGQHDPGYEDAKTQPGKPVEVPQTKDKNIPPGTEFEGPKDVPSGWTVEVDPNIGKVTVTPPADATPGTEVNIPVTVHYPDGSTETTNVKVTVDQPEGPSTHNEGQGKQPTQPKPTMDNNCPTGDVEHTSTKGEKAPTSPSAQTEGNTEVPAQTPTTTHNTMNNGAETADQEQHASQDTMSSDEKAQPTHTTTHSDAKALPETGETDAARTTAFGSLFAGLGALLLFRRRKNSKDEQ